MKGRNQGREILLQSLLDNEHADRNQKRNHNHLCHLCQMMRITHKSKHNFLSLNLSLKLERSISAIRRRKSAKDKEKPNHRMKLLKIMIKDLRRKEKMRMMTICSKTIWLDSQTKLVLSVH